MDHDSGPTYKAMLISTPRYCRCPADLRIFARASQRTPLTLVSDGPATDTEDLALIDAAGASQRRIKRQGALATGGGKEVLCHHGASYSLMGSTRACGTATLSTSAGDLTGDLDASSREDRFATIQTEVARLQTEATLTVERLSASLAPRRAASARVRSLAQIPSLWPHSLGDTDLEVPGRARLGTRFGPTTRP